MLVVGISFSTSLSLCCIICCVIFFIIVKRNKRLAFKKQVDKKQQMVDQQIGSLEETLKDVKAQPVASPSDIEQNIDDVIPPEKSKYKVGQKIGKLTIMSAGFDHTPEWRTFDKVYPSVVSANDNSQFSTNAFVLVYPCRSDKNRTCCIVKNKTLNTTCGLSRLEYCDSVSKGVVPGDVAFFELHKINGKVRLFQLQTLSDGTYAMISRFGGNSNTFYNSSKDACVAPDTYDVKNVIDPGGDTTIYD